MARAHCHGSRRCIPGCGASQHGPVHGVAPLCAVHACARGAAPVDLRPLTPRAKQRAIGVLKELSACLLGFGYKTGRPVVENLPRGRAFFGFKDPRSTPPSARLRQAQHTCEKRVNLPGKLDRIIAEDRSGL